MSLVRWVALIVILGMVEGATKTQTVSISLSESQSLSKSTSQTSSLTSSISMPTMSESYSNSLSLSSSISATSVSMSQSMSLPTASVTYSLTNTYSNSLTFSSSLSFSSSLTETFSQSMSGSLTIPTGSETFSKSLSETESATGSLSDSYSVSLTFSLSLPTGTETYSLTLPTGSTSYSLTVSFSLPTSTATKTFSLSLPTRTLTSSATYSLTVSMSIPTASATFTSETSTFSVTLPTASMTFSESLTFTISMSLPTETESASGSSLYYNNVTFTLSNNVFIEGDDLRIRISPVEEGYDQSYIKALWNISKPKSIQFKVYKYNADVGSYLCGSYISSGDVPLFQGYEFGLRYGESREMTDSAFFTFTAPHHSVSFVMCLRHVDDSSVVGVDFSESTDSWILLTTDGAHTSNKEPSGKFLFQSGETDLFYYLSGEQTVNKHVVVKIVSLGTYSLKVSSTSCVNHEDSACSYGDNVKIVKRGVACSGVEFQTTEFAGTKMVATTGEWSSIGRSRYCENTCVGCVGRQTLSPTSSPFSESWDATTATTQSGKYTAYSYIRLPGIPGDYEICISPYNMRGIIATAVSSSIASGDVLPSGIDNKPLWRKLYPCNETVCDYATTSDMIDGSFYVQNETMAWQIFDATPGSWGIIRFLGYNLKASPSEAGITTTPSGDAFRVVPSWKVNNVPITQFELTSDTTSETTVSSGCFGEYDIISESVYPDGSINLLDGDPTHTHTYHWSNMTYSTVFIPTNGTFFICYRKWDEGGSWRLLPYILSELGDAADLVDITLGEEYFSHPILGNLVEYNYTFQLRGGYYHSTSHVIDTSRTNMVWTTVYNETRAETLCPVSVYYANFTNPLLPTWNWIPSSGNGGVLRLVRIDRPCDSFSVTEYDLPGLNASQSTNGGTLECREDGCLTDKFDSPLPEVFYNILMPRDSWGSHTPYRVCHRVGWGNWQVSEVDSPLVILPRPTVKLSLTNRQEVRQIFDSTILFSDIGSSLSTDDEVRFVPVFKDILKGQIVTTTGNPKSGANDIYWPIGQPGIVWETGLSGVRLTHPSGETNAWFDARSIRRELNDCTLRFDNFYPRQSDRNLQPVCLLSGGYDLNTSGLLSPQCNSLGDLQHYCKLTPGHRCDKSDYIKNLILTTRDIHDDIVPGSSNANQLEGVAAVVEIPKHSYREWFLCYKPKNAGWLQISRLGSGVDFNIDETWLPSSTTITVSPSHKDGPLLGGSIQPFEVAASDGAIISIFAKMVRQVPSDNQNCLSPPVGTPANMTSSSSMGPNSFSKMPLSITGLYPSLRMMLPTASGEYWLCLDIQTASHSGTLSWIKMGPYVVAANNVSWEVNQNMINLAILTIKLHRSGDANIVFNTSKGADAAKVVSATDVCDENSISVDTKSVDMGPSVGLNKIASIITTLPLSLGDAPAVYHVCVKTFFSLIGAFRWVEAVSLSDADKPFTTQPSRVRDWILHPMLTPQYDLQLGSHLTIDGKERAEITVAGASTMLPSSSGIGFTVRLWERRDEYQNISTTSTLLSKRSPDVDFKLVSIGEPILRKPVNSSGASWTWNIDHSKSCLNAAVYGTTPSVTSQCDPAIHTNCVFAAMPADDLNINFIVQMTMPDVGAYIFCFKIGSDPWLQVPSSTWKPYIATVPSYKQFDRETQWNITVGDTRVDWVTGKELPNWCGNTINCTDYVQYQSLDRVCSPPEVMGVIQPGHYHISNNLLDNPTDLFISQNNTSIFRFPPLLGSAVYKVCIHQVNHSPQHLTNSTVITRSNVSYALFNTCPELYAGGTLFWRRKNAVNNLLMFIENGEQLINMSNVLSLNESLRISLKPGVILIVRLQTAIGSLAVPSSGSTSLLQLTHQRSVKNSFGCYGQHATQFSWNQAGLKQILSESGSVYYHIEFTQSCPVGNECHFKFDAILSSEGTTHLTSRTLEVTITEEEPDSFVVNGYKRDQENYHTITCYTNEVCTITIEALKKGPRLYAIKGGNLRITQNTEIADNSVRGGSTSNSVELMPWSSKGSVIIKKQFSLHTSAVSVSIRYNATIEGYWSVYEIVVARRIPTVVHISIVLPDNSNYRENNELPTPLWEAATGGSVGYALPSNMLIAAQGSYFQTQRLYKVYYQLRDATGELVRDPTGLKVCSTITGAFPTTINNGNTVWNNIMPAGGDGLFVISFIVSGGTGCSRLNNNRPIPKDHRGNGCDINIEVRNSYNGDTILSGTIRSPIRQKATSLRILTPGNTLDGRNRVQADIQTGLRVQLVPGSLISGVFIVDEFHYGEIYPLLGVDGLSHHGINIEGAEKSPLKMEPSTIIVNATYAKWGVDWILRTTEPCDSCLISFHSDEGGTPEGNEGWINATFSDTTTGLRCQPSVRVANWLSDKPTSDEFNIVVEPITSGGRNSHWPRWTAEIDLLNAASPMLLESRLENNNYQTVGNVSSVMNSSLMGSSAVFSLRITGTFLKISSTASILIRVNGVLTDLTTVKYTCVAQIQIRPLSATNITSLIVTGISGAQAMCQGCVSKDTCNCHDWVFDTSQQSLSMHFSFFNTTSTASFLDWRSRDVSIRPKGAQFPQWVCNQIGPNSDCSIASPVVLKSDFADVIGFDDIGLEKNYTFGSCDPVVFTRIKRHGVTAFEGQGTIKIEMTNPTPVRKSIVELCEVISSGNGLGEEISTAIGSPGCVEVRIWIRSFFQRDLLVGIPKILTSHSSSSDNLVTLKAGGSSDSTTCGGDPHSVININALLYYKISSVNYIRYDLPAYFTVSHQVGALVKNINSSLAWDTQFPFNVLYGESAIAVLSLSFFKPVGEDSLSVSANTPSGAVVLPYVSGKLYKSHYTDSSMQYTAIRLRSAVFENQECPSNISMSYIRYSGHVTHLPHAGINAVYTEGKAGIPLPIEVYIENNLGVRSWGFPTSIIIISLQSPTTGCGTGGVFSVLISKVNHIKTMESSFHESEQGAVQMTGGVARCWIKFSEPCEHCVLRIELCSPGISEVSRCSDITSKSEKSVLSSERVLLTKPFSVVAAEATDLVVSEHNIPDISINQNALIPVSLVVGKPITLSVKPVIRVSTSSKWIFPFKAKFSGYIINKYVGTAESFLPSKGRYGNGGFLTRYEQPTSYCNVHPSHLDAANRFGVSFSVNSPAAVLSVIFTYTRPCSKCEIWVHYKLGDNVEQAFAVRHSSGNVVYLNVGSCGVKWLLAAAPRAVVRSRPFSLTSWWVDNNHNPSWVSPDRTKFPTFTTPVKGIGGNGGGGDWVIGSPVHSEQGLKRIISESGSATMKLTASRACYSCTLQYADNAVAVTVVTEATQFTIIPSSETSLLSHIQIANTSNSSTIAQSAEATYNFTIYASDELLDRAFLLGGPTPRVWYAGKSTVNDVSINFDVSPQSHISIPWRPDIIQHDPVVTVRGSCIINGAPYGELCNEKGMRSGQLSITAKGIFHGIPIIIVIDGQKLQIPTKLLGIHSAPAISQTITATDIEIPPAVGVVPDVEGNFTIYSIGSLGQFPNITWHSAAINISNASVWFDCTECLGCQIQPQTVIFSHSIAVVKILLKGLKVARGTCIATVTSGDIVKHSTITAELIARANWVFISSDTIEVLQSPALRIKDTSSRLNSNVTIILRAYSSDYRSSDGGIVEWGAVGVDHAEIISTPPSCFNTTKILIRSHGAELQANGRFVVLPCILVGIQRNGLPVLPSTTSWNQILRVSSTEPVGMEVVQQSEIPGRPPVNFTNQRAILEGGRSATYSDETIVITVRTVTSAGQTATGDFQTVASLTATRLGKKIHVSATTVSGIAKIPIKFYYQRDGGIDLPWTVRVRGIPTLYNVFVVPKIDMITVLIREMPIVGLPATPWRYSTPNDNGLVWGYGYQMQLRLMHKGRFLNQSDVALTVDAVEMPCSSLDKNITWMEYSCLPVNVTKQLVSRKPYLATRTCSELPLPVCEFTEWTICPFEKLVVNSSVSYMKQRDSGSLTTGRVKAIFNSGISVATSNTSNVVIAEEYLHDSRCIPTRPHDSTSLVKFTNGVGMLQGFLYRGYRSGDVHLRLSRFSKFSEEWSQQIITFKIQKVNSLTLYEDYCQHHSSGGRLCPAPFENSTHVQSNRAYDIRLAVRDKYNKIIKGDNITVIQLSAACLEGDKDFRAGVSGGISGLQVNVPNGWNISKVVNGIAVFERIAFHGSCSKAIITASCISADTDLFNQCKGLKLITSSFTVVSWESVPSEGLPPVQEDIPIQQVSQPSLVMDMGSIPVFQFDSVEKSFMEFAMLDSIHQKASFPKDIKAVFIMHVCSVGRVRSSKGLSDADRGNPLVCRSFPVPTERDYEVLANNGTLPEIENCGAVGCTALIEFVIVVINPSSIQLANDVFSACKSAIVDETSPIRSNYDIDPNTAMISTTVPVFPPTEPPTPSPSTAIPFFGDPPSDGVVIVPYTSDGSKNCLVGYLVVVAVVVLVFI